MKTSGESIPCEGPGAERKACVQRTEEGRGARGEQEGGRETGRGRGVTVGLLRESVGREADGKARSGGPLSSGMM